MNRRKNPCGAAGVVATAGAGAGAAAAATADWSGTIEAMSSVGIATSTGGAVVASSTERASPNAGKATSREVVIKINFCFRQFIVCLTRNKFARRLTTLGGPSQRFHKNYVSLSSKSIETGNGSDSAPRSGHSQSIG
jgi:hypothetical protein